ncbi:MAG TPA: serine hydrolase domain-containing protein [Gemmatimonadaceae bacterium]|nr:serine hydrolase domain-containing protein [Gemmatimonadaceae bacterium]
MKRIESLAFTAMLAAPFMAAHAQAPDFSHARRLILAGMARDSVPAVAIAVVRDGRIIWEEGFGWSDPEHRIAATPNTPFALASLTKSFVAVAAMALQERGQLDLDRPVNEYLRTASVWSPAWNASAVTLRRLLNHTAGLSTFDLWCADARNRCTLPSADETIRRFGAITSRPGSAFDYSNLGYLVAGEAVARAHRETLAATLRDEVFLPLGMRHSSLGIPDSAFLRATAVPMSSSVGLVPLEVGLGGSGASHGFASAHDLALFGAFLLETPLSGQSKILPDAAIDSLLSSIEDDAGRSTGYGLGFWVEANRKGYRTALAQGGTDRAQAWLRLVPTERIAVALLADKGVGFPETVVDDVIAALLPNYRAALDTKRGTVASTAVAAATEPRPVDSAIVGTWTGTIHTADGAIPIRLVVGAMGDVRATVGTYGDTGRARLTASGVFRVHIPTAALQGPAWSGAAPLDFYLRRLGSGYGGTATTAFRQAPIEGRVSYYADIRRP